METIILDYKSPPIYVGYEYHNEDDGLAYQITSIEKVEVVGAETRVYYKFKEIPL
jgi:hypothetical protein